MNEMNEQTKIPFYMISPMQKLYQMEMEYEKDMERMKALYPREVQQLMPLVEDYCDGLEYEGSRIYDENPDAVMMCRECGKLIQKIKENEQNRTDPDEEKHSKENKNEENIPEGEPIQAAEVKNVKRTRGIFAFNPPDGWELPPGRKSGPSQPCERQLCVQQNNSPQSGMNPSQISMNSPQSGMNPPQNHHWREDLIALLFHNEIFRRRSRHRRCCRWW